MKKATKIVLGVTAGILVLGAIGSTTGSGGAAQAAHPTVTNNGDPTSNPAAKDLEKVAPPERKTVKVSGHGIEKTEKVELNGDYEVKMTWSHNTLAGVTAANLILNLDGEMGVGEDILANEISTSGSKTTHIYNKGGFYVVDGNAQGDWTVTFNPK